jgi:hypothetical protein
VADTESLQRVPPSLSGAQQILGRGTVVIEEQDVVIQLHAAPEFQLAMNDPYGARTELNEAILSGFGAVPIDVPWTCALLTLSVPRSGSKSWIVGAITSEGRNPAKKRSSWKLSLRLAPILMDADDERLGLLDAEWIRCRLLLCAQAIPA